MAEGRPTLAPRGWGARLCLGALFLLPCGAAWTQDFSHGEQVAGPQLLAMQAANEALAANDWAKAVTLLKPLAEADPKNAQVLYDLGSAHDALDQEAAAEESYRASVMDAAGFLEPHLALGLLLARQGKMEDARAELKAAASIEKGDKLLRARALRAMARIDQKSRPADARDELLGALALSPETPEDTLMTAELAESAAGGKDAAEAAYRSLLLRNPNEPGATASLAHLLLQQKRYADAEKLLANALAVHPNDEGMTIQLAEVYMAERKTAEALPLVESLHAANPKDPGTARLLAELYLQAKDYARAEPLLSTLATQNPQDGVVVDLDAEALLHLHQAPQAQRILSRVVAQPALFQSTDDWGLAASDLALAAHENDEPALTLQILQTRAKVLPTTAPIWFLTAISEDKLHHVKEAEQAYRNFLAASNGENPNEEFEARHRLVALAPRK